MAKIEFNPFTGKFDLVGSGGSGTSYLDGEVEFHGDLPVTVGVPGINSAFLVRKGSGIYFLSRKPAGIWVRELNNGNLDDWKYAGTFSDLYRDANFRIINDTDTSKEIAFSAALISSGTTRVITPPDKNITLDDSGDTRPPSAHTHTPSEVGLGNVANAAQVTSVTGTAPITSSGGTAPAISISAATTSAAGSMSAADKLKLDGIAAGAEVNVNADWNASSGDAQILNKPSSFAPSSHGSTHHTGGTDAIAPNNIGAAWVLETRSHSFFSTSTYTLPQGRNVQLNVSLSASGVTGTITLPRLTTDSAQNGDDLFIVATGFGSGQTLVIERYIWTGSSYIGSTESVVTTTTGGAWRFRLLQGVWTLQPVANHTQPASTITGLATVATTGDYDDLTDKPTLGGAAALNIGTGAGTVAAGDDARFTDARAPLSHAASHAAAGSDPLAPSDIGAQSLFIQTTIDNTSNPSPYQIAASRARTLRVFASDNYTVRLPASGHTTGDIVDVFADTLSATKTITIERDISASGVWITVGTISAQGSKRRFVANGTGSSNWAEDRYFTTDGTIGAPASHTHAASQITSGTLTHERGGLEADVSAYDGLVKISGGSTSAVGIGTGSTQVASGDHTHGNITNDGKVGSTAGLPLVTTTAGAVTTLALGSAGQVLKVNSGGTAVEFGAASGGDTQVFTANGTWTKPAGATMVHYLLIGGGGGGGAGCRRAANSTRGGGGGGAGGSISAQWINASQLGSTESVTVGAGGSGGANAADNIVPGANGSDGGLTSFGGVYSAFGGPGGSGGSTGSSGGGNTGANRGIFYGSALGTGSGGAGAGAATGGGGAATQTVVATGGGGGGGINSSNVTAAGGGGGTFGGAQIGTTLGGAAAANSAGANGGATTQSLVGTGGGGGSPNSSTFAGNVGGNGALYGGGGGGGSGALNSAGGSTAGGDGANGIVIITTYF